MEFKVGDIVRGIASNPAGYAITCDRGLFKVLSLSNDMALFLIEVVAWENNLYSKYAYTVKKEYFRKANRRDFEYFGYKSSAQKKLKSWTMSNGD